MTEELITFETAKLAKEKGFDVKCRHWYDQTGALNPIKGTRGAMCYTNEGCAPTQSLLQKWLRESKDLHVCIESGYDVMLKYNRGYRLAINGKQFWYENDVFETYELALEKGLSEALKLIK